ncbi:hypothetical protein HCN44_005181 [Aphidius gifuensis]|uniref:Peptidase M3A/M3B catalytic domain-containing protein n=1 Tax=Aphidius gifuensis TaxID=684658 RepID=A0A835CR26_APHGI|nr:hypothetical protein HCN44_005181 [Aphidius gifuensis]
MSLLQCVGRVLKTRNNFMKRIINKRNYCIIPQKNYLDDNLLFEKNGQPKFELLSEKSLFIIEAQVNNYNKNIKIIEETINNNKNIDIVDGIIKPLEKLNLTIETTLGIIKTMYIGNKNLILNDNYKKIQEHMFKLNYLKYNNLSIYKIFNEYIENDYRYLNGEEKKIIKNYVLKSKLNGIEVENENKLKFVDTVEKIKNNINIFNEKIDILNSIFYDNNENNLTTIKNHIQPYSSVDIINFQDDKSKIILKPKIVSQLLENCSDRDVRMNIWNKYHNDPSTINNDKQSENIINVIEDIRVNRNEQAKILGYDSYSNMSVETKSAGNLHDIYEIMDSLLEKALPSQELELKKLHRFARKRGFIGELCQWDIDYWMNKRRQSKLNLFIDNKNESIEEYFTFPRVLNGLLNTIENLFNVKIIEGKNTNTWHCDVKFFDIFDLKYSSTNPIAHFYLDPYARIDKKINLTNGKLITIQNKSKFMNKKPLSSLIFNFKPPINNNIPSLLTIDDVKLLFHKFGSLLQHSLTTVQYSDHAGLTNIDLDAIELSGYFMENILYDSSVLKNINCHYKTNELLSSNVIESIQETRSFMAGYNLCKELFLSRLDLELHQIDKSSIEIMKLLYDKHFIIPQVINNKFFINTWHVMANKNNNYNGANYYSNLWSKIMADDIYKAIREIPIECVQERKDVIEEFKNTFLSLGGSVNANDIFYRFRTRDPTTCAIIENFRLTDGNNDDSSSDLSKIFDVYMFYSFGHTLGTVASTVGSTLEMI